MRQSRPLKLLARDEEDLDVIGAILQDALVPVMDTTYLRDERRFVMVTNRFLWREAARGDAPAKPPAIPDDEDASFEDAAGAPPFARVNCGVFFDTVARVRSRGFDMSEKDQILNLLTIKAETGLISLFFSDNGVIELQVEKIACQLEDIGEVWPTRWRPDHETPAQGAPQADGDDANGP